MNRKSHPFSLISKRSSPAGTRSNSISPCRSVLRWAMIALAAGFFPTAPGAPPVSPDAPAKSVSTSVASGPKGIACLPRCETAARALELAESTGYLVLALEVDPARAAVLREELAKTGALGRTVYVEEGTLEATPLADHSVDLILLDGTTSASLTPSEKAEIKRLLTPVLGRAVLKDQTLTQPELPGSDWWTHRLRAPDNNFASRDTAFQWPPILQYRAMPAHSSYQGGALSLPGRNVEMNDWVIKEPWRANLAGRLLVRNAYNGCILWTDLIPEGIEPSMAVAAGDADTLYIAAGDRAAVVRRSLADGAQLPPIEVGGPGERIRWLAVQNGILYTASGPNNTLREPFNWALQPKVTGAQQKGHTLHLQTLRATDLATGKTLWQHAEDGPLIDFRSLALNGESLVFYVEGKRLVALDPTTGKERWRNEDPAWISNIKRPPVIRNVNVDLMPNLLIGEGLVRFIPHEARATLLFRAEDGALVANQPHKGRFVHSGQKLPLVRRDGKLFLGLTEIDPATGEVGAAELPAPVGTFWCGIATYSPGIGMIGHHAFDIKSPCGIGAWTAGGLFHHFPSVCDCGGLAGAAAFAGGREVFQRAKEAPEHPLVQGPAFGKTPSRVESPNDWAAYRRDTRHSGGSPVAVANPARLRWTASPENPYAYGGLDSQELHQFDERPVPAIVAAGLVFSTGSDGVVQAHSLEDGKLVWSYALAGGVLTSPTVMEGRLFVPCLDGRVYAFDAATGDLIWQRRLAPVERRIPIFGLLASNWPVLSLAAADGRVYAAAGYVRSDGGKAFALDAATGEILWQRWFDPIQPGKGDTPLDSYGFGGYTTLLKDKVWAAGLISVPMILEASTGQQAIMPVGEEMDVFLKKGYGSVVHHLQSLGQEIINVDDRYIISGGGMLLENHNVRDAKNIRTNFKLLFTDEDGRFLLDPSRLSSRIIQTARIAPAYDAEDFCFVSRYESQKEKGDRKVLIGNAGLNLWDKEAFFAKGSTLQREPAVVIGEGGKRKAEVVDAREIFDLLPYDQGKWSKPEVMANAVALAANAVVVTEATAWSTPSKTWDTGPLTQRASLLTVKGWQLTAYNRTDGAVLWTVPLPSEPLFNGLAIAADGSIVVTLRDGTLVAVGS